MISGFGVEAWLASLDTSLELAKRGDLVTVFDYVCEMRILDDCLFATTEDIRMRLGRILCSIPLVKNLPHA